MKRVKAVKLGVCPIGKFVFSHEDAVRQKDRLFRQLDAWHTNYCTIDQVLPDGMVRDQGHVGAVVEHFKREAIDALFIPHCNFGTEGAAGMIAKACGVPVLLWGPRDGPPLPDGSRLRDSLCGMLATSKVLHTLKVPFTYINNCETESEQFRVGFDRFHRAARVVKTLKTMRIGQLGGRIDFFWSTIASEIELLRRFGVQVIPIDMADLLVRVKERAATNRDAYRAELAKLQKRIAFHGYADADGPLPNFAFRDELLALGDALQLDGFSIQSFSSIQNILGTATALAQAQVADAGYPVAPESDVHGVISSLLLEAASGTDDPAFLADITIRHPDNDNAVLLWHVDAPLSLADPASKLSVGPPWILKGLPSGHLHFKLKDGPLTFCRFDGDGEKYRLGVGDGRTVGGAYTQEFYAWMEVDRWEMLERQLIYGPYIHHTSFAYDRCAEVLQEASRYIPGLDFEQLG